MAARGRLHRARRRFRAVHETLLAREDGGWVVLGNPEHIDLGSGTTPDEYLTAVRNDIGGVTLRRVSDGMTGLTTLRLDDGSTVYRGTVAAGLVAGESGFKEGRPIRVLPLGYVAHDQPSRTRASVRPRPWSPRRPPVRSDRTRATAQGG